MTSCNCDYYGDSNCYTHNQNHPTRQIEKLKQEIETMQRLYEHRKTMEGKVLHFTIQQIDRSKDEDYVREVVDLRHEIADLKEQLAISDKALEEIGQMAHTFSDHGKSPCARCIAENALVATVGTVQKFKKELIWQGVMISLQALEAVSPYQMMPMSNVSREIPGESFKQRAMLSIKKLLEEEKITINPTER